MAAGVLLCSREIKFAAQFLGSCRRVGVVLVVGGGAAVLV